MPHCRHCRIDPGEAGYANPKGTCHAQSPPSPVRASLAAVLHPGRWPGRAAWLKVARFPAYRDLTGFDFTSSEINEALVRQLHRCDSIEPTGNVVLVGGPESAS